MIQYIFLVKFCICDTLYPRDCEESNAGFICIVEIMKLPIFPQGWVRICPFLGCWLEVWLCILQQAILKNRLRYRCQFFYLGRIQKHPAPNPRTMYLKYLHYSTCSKFCSAHQKCHPVFAVWPANDCFSAVCPFHHFYSFFLYSKDVQIMWGSQKRSYSSHRGSKIVPISHVSVDCPQFRPQ